MTWFKVDDHFALHPKAIEAGNAALGLWVRAGAWCAGNLTDGCLPAAMLAPLGGRKRDAERLVRARLWGEIEGGYQFLDWSDWQPTKAQVIARREKTKEKVAEWRSRNASNPVTNRVGNQGGNPAPDPTRPDPTSITTTGEGISRTERARRLPEDWQPNADLVAWQRQDFPSVDGRLETEKFRDYWHSKTETRTDWNKVWRNWIRKAAEMAPRTGLKPESWPVSRSTTDQRVDAGRDLTARLLAEESNNHLELT